MSRKPAKQRKAAAGRWPALVEGRENKPDIRVIMGDTGAGKTSYVMAELDKGQPDRLLIWDTKGEFSDEGYAKRVNSITDLVKEVRKAGNGPFRLALVPYGSTQKQMVSLFDLFCRVAYEARRCVVVAEELSDVCNGGTCNAAGWRKLITQGRTRGFRIFPLTQRPALIDKTALSQATLIRTGLLGSAKDAAVVAEVMWVDKGEVLALQPLEYIEYSKVTRSHRRGSLLDV